MHTAFRTRLLTNRLTRLAFLVLLIGPSGPALGTALDDYVAAPDDSYAWSRVSTISGPGYTVHVIDLKSQQWRSAAEVLDGRHIWQHWLLIIIPDTVLTNQSLLFIDGGSNGKSAPEEIDPFLAILGNLAVSTHSVVTQLRMVPNERLKFADETDPRYIDDGRTEDEIIAYTFDKFLATGDDTWPLLLPMVKSAVRAMDTITDFCASRAGGSISVNEFVVSGASKRGWTTWLTAAVDDRVIAIIPAVIDVLNMDVQMEHHFSAYGFFSPAIQDYGDLNIFERFDLPKAQELLKIVDPYEYRDRLKDMPRYMLNSTGDQFFLPDSAQFYIDDLEGQRFMRYIPNTDHGLGLDQGRLDAPESLSIFYTAILNDLALPKFSWTVEADGSIRVETTTVPSQVNLWQATNPFERNFMLVMTGPIWKSTTLTDQGGGVYVGNVPDPVTGWTAYMVELVYPTVFSPILPDMKFTTQIVVTPDELPFPQTPDCNGNDFSDSLDIANGTDPDCDSNGTPDSCDIAKGTDDDCNDNGVPDLCDLAASTSTDCDENGEPDDCQPDSDNDGTIDACEENADQPVTFSLTVAVSGSGTVAVTPNKNDYDPGETVALNASAETGWQFTGWSGGSSAGTSSITIQMNSDVFLTASFDNPAPVASIGGPYDGQVGQNIAFDASQSTDPLGEALTMQWDFGDGFSAEGATPGHTYTSAGTFDVSLTVIDPVGNSATATTTAGVIAASPPPPPPAPTPTPTTTEPPAPPTDPLSSFLATFCGGLQPLTLLMTFAGMGLMRTRRWH